MSDWKSRAKPADSNWKSRAAPVEEPVSLLESALRGVAQGATADNADEISGAFQEPYGALKTAVDPLIGSDVNDQDIKNYKAARDSSRHQFEQAEQANPKMYATGNVVGGVVPLSIPIGGEVVAGAKAAEKAASLASLMKAGLIGGAKAGAGYGAVQGFGASKDELGLNTAGDVGAGAATGAIGGGLIGGAAPAVLAGAKGAASGVADLGRGVKDYITENVPYAEKLSKVYDYTRKGVDLTSKTARKNINEEFSNLPNVIAKELAGKEEGTLAKTVSDAYNAAEENFKASGKTIDNTQLLDDLITKVEQTEVPGTEQPNKDSLLKLLKKRRLGPEINIDVPTVTELEPKRVPATQSGAEDLQDQIKKMKINDAASGSRARYEIIPTKEGEESYLTLKRVVDEPVGGGRSSEANTSMTTKTIEDYPAVPEQVIPQFENDVQKVVARDATQSQANPTLDQFKNLQTDLKPYNEGTLKGTIGGVLSKLQDAKYNEILNDPKLRVDYRNLMNTMENLGLSKPINGVMQDSPELKNILINMNRAGVRTPKAQADLDNLIKTAKGIDPAKGEQLQKQIKDISDRWNLSSYIGNEGHLSDVGALLSGGLRGAATAGKIVNKVSGSLTNGKNLVALPFEEAANLANKLRASGSPKQALLVETFANIKDNPARKAAMAYALSQDEKIRKAMGQ